MTADLNKSALIIGKGSIGLRHAEVLNMLGYHVSFVSRRIGDDVNVFKKSSDAFRSRKFQVVVISTETAHHADDLMKVITEGFDGTVLVEKPIFRTTQEYKHFPALNSIFVGYNMRFNPLIQRLRERLSSQKIISLQAYVGENLNNWRSDRKTLETYSASKVAGGGVLRDLSHELDLVNWLLGPLEVRGVCGGRMGNVTSDAEDFVTSVMTSKSGAAVGVTLSYLDMKPSRRLIVNTIENTYVLDFLAKEFWENQSCEKFSYDRNASYLAMHRALERGDRKDVCDLIQGLAVLKLIESIESRIVP